MHTFQRILLSRDIVKSDLIKCQEILVKQGYHVCDLDRCEGGICFLVDGKDIGKDVRFIHCDWLDNYRSCTHQSILVPFQNDDENPWTHDNMLTLKFRDHPNNTFTIQEVKDVVNIVTQVFSATADTIYNDIQCGLTKELQIQNINSFSDESFNIYVGYDLKLAIEIHTIPCDRWPDIHAERLFQCWKCNNRRPWFHFTPGTGFVPQSKSFIEVLDRCQFNFAPCCNDCTVKFVFGQKQ
jgi:hypothetical protein